MIPDLLRVRKEPLWTGAVCAYPWDETLAQRFTVASKYDDGTPMKLWSTPGEGLIGLPWNCCPPANDDRRSDGWKIHVKHKVVARNDDQARIMAEAGALLSKGRSFIIEAPTGTGKTVIALKLFAELGKSTIVIVPKDDLIDQWIERVLQCTNLKASEIGRLQADTLDVKGKPIVIASLASVAKEMRYPAWVYSNFGFVIFDEVHRCGADLLGEAVRMFSASQRLGLSATPERKDGKDLVLYAHIGPIAVRGTTAALDYKVLVMQTQWRCPRDGQGNKIPHKPGRITHILKSIAGNSRRNRGLCEIIQAAHIKKRKIVVFSALIDHLETIESMLPRWNIPASDIGRYYGKTTKAQLEHAASKPVITATYSKMSEGTDIPSIDTILLASPMADVRQAIGRGLRLDPNKQPPVIFDIVDPDSSVLVGYAKARHRHYRSVGAEIVSVAFPDV